MRRLLVLVAALVAVETMLFAALTPLLPHFAEEFGFSKSRVGVLVAAYAAGALVGGLPGGVAAARMGGRKAVLVGLALMGTASLGFAFAGDFSTLFVARFIQGCAGGFLWAGAFAWLLAVAPRDRRGELIGVAMGAAIFGALFGPVLGAAAAILGRAPVFAALSVLALVLGLWAVRLESAPAEQPSLAAMRRALRHPRFMGGLVLMLLPSLLIGILSVLGPLHLSAAGWGAAAIGAVWLVGAAIEAVQAPLIGRLSDRRGRLLPVRIALVCGAIVSLGLATTPRPLGYAPLIVAACFAYGMLFTPAFALIADGADSVGLAQGMAFGLMNAAWALGAMVGPAAAGAIASATGDWIPFLIAAGLCVVVLAGLRALLRNDRSAVLVDRLAGDAAGVRPE
jgi:MFS family permease